MTTSTSNKTNNNKSPSSVPSSSTEPSAAASPKKRRKTSPTTTTRKKKEPSNSTTATKKKQTSPVASTSSSLKRSEAPTRTLILDNGGETIKYGWITTTTASDKSAAENVVPQSMTNATARLQQQWTILAGDQLQTAVQDPNQLVGLTRSTERGMLVHLGTQIQVWKRLLEVLQVNVPLHTETAQALGWNKKRARPSGAAGTTTSENDTMIAPHTCAVLMGLAPWTPRTILDQIMTIWMQDFGFAHVGFCVSAACAGRPVPNLLQTRLVVDLGWSSVTVCPTVMVETQPQPQQKDPNKPVESATTTVLRQTIVKEAIRRMPLGGRHLINAYKYYSSYRQYNLMDQEWILRQVLHQAGTLSLQFEKDLEIACNTPAGQRPYDREFVLPDYQTTLTGVLRLPPALQQEQDNEDGDYQESQRMDVEDEEDDDEESNQENEQDVDSEDEDPEALRQRLLKERQEEQKRRQEQAAEQQVLNLSVERFAVPELLFRPSDAGLPVEWAGLHQAIASSILACPVYLQAAMCRSIKLVGGLANMENLQARLTRELRSLLPCQFALEIETVGKSNEEERQSDPSFQAWYGAHDLATSAPYTTWSVSREEWENASRRGGWKRLVDSGQIV